MAKFLVSYVQHFEMNCWYISAPIICLFYAKFKWKSPSNVLHAINYAAHVEEILFRHILPHYANFACEKFNSLPMRLLLHCTHVRHYFAKSALHLLHNQSSIICGLKSCVRCAVRRAGIENIEIDSIKLSFVTVNWRLECELVKHINWVKWEGVEYWIKVY